MNKRLNLDEPINICIFGARGQGKSLLATHLIVDHAKKNKDVKIFHNNVLKNFPNSYNFNLEDFTGEFPEEAKNSIFFIDEVNYMADPRRTMTTFQQMFDNTVIMQRKLGISLIMTTQKPKDLSGRLLQQLDYEIIVEKKYIDSEDYSKFNIHYEVTVGENNPKMIKRFGKYNRFYRARLIKPYSLFKYYDTAKAQDFRELRKYDSAFIKSKNTSSQRNAVDQFLYNHLYPILEEKEGENFALKGYVDEWCDWFEEATNTSIEEKEMNRALRSCGLSIRSVNGARRLTLDKKVVDKRIAKDKLLSS